MTPDTERSQSNPPLEREGLVAEQVKKNQDGGHTEQDCTTGILVKF